MEKLPPSPDVVEETLRELDKQIEKLEQELSELNLRRQRWASVLSALLTFEEAGASVPVCDTLKSRIKVSQSSLDSFRREMDRTSAISRSEYGDFTKKMRRYLVGIQARLTYRSEIVKYAREMKASTNFPYHFLKRMLENGELIEPMKGRYQATPLMVERVAEYDPSEEEVKA